MTEDPDSPRPALEITIQDPLWAETVVSAASLARRAAAAALDAVSLPREGQLEVSLVLSDDARVRVLNRDYRDQDRPTNVLSFASGETPLLGDVVLARETVVREAAEQGKDAGDHLTHLVVHGVLHLLGYDHETDGDAAEMESLEVAILAGLKIGDPYAPNQQQVERA